MIYDRQSLESEILSVLNRPDQADKVGVWVRLGEARILRQNFTGEQKPNVDYQEPILPLGAEAGASTWFLIIHPDAYLYSALIDASLFFQDREAAMLYERLFRDVTAHVLRESRRYPPNATLQSVHTHPTDEASRGRPYRPVARQPDRFDEVF